MTLRLVFNEINTNLKQILSILGFSKIEFEILDSPRKELGDLSCNLSFLLAKKLKKKPYEISKLISVEYAKISSRLVKQALAHESGYLNFYINYPEFNKLTIFASREEDYGKINLGKKSKIVVEHTSVNPNKALHIGHVRNIIIGDSIARILKKANYDVRILNYVDDSGLQVADIIVGFKFGGFPLEPIKNQKFDHYCGDIVYVKTIEKYESDPWLLSQRTVVLKQLEDNTSEIAIFSAKITKRVLEEQLKTCWRLGATYDCLNFESQIVHSNLWNITFEKMKSMNLIELEQDGKNNGCWVIKSENNEEDKILVRSNGIATYIAKDIPYAAWKLGILEDPFYYKKYSIQSDQKILWQTVLEKDSNEKLDFRGERVITVIDSRQTRLQKIITKLMSDFNTMPLAYVHLAYESVTLSPETASMLNVNTSGKQLQMSGRKGIYVNADNVLDALGKKTWEEAKKRNPETDKQKLVEISEKIAVGALRYSMIKQDLDKIIAFDMNESLNLEGDTAPYILYAFVRASRIIEKASFGPVFNDDISHLITSYEIDLILNISKFDIKVEDSASNFSPKVLAKYCHDMAVSFNGFYEHVKVLTAENNELTNARLCLVWSFKETLSKALSLIGIATPERM